MNKKFILRSVFFILCMLICSTAIGFAAQENSNDLVVGPGMFTMPEGTGNNADDLQVFYHRPGNWTPDRPIMIVMHGTNRNAEVYRNTWQEQADAYNFLLVCPEMTEKKYPGTRYYNIGNVVDGDQGGKVQPTKDWVFPVIDRVFDQVRDRSGATANSYSLYGHSAGAQFVHRYLLLAPESKAKMIISANAGWYTMPDTNSAFPFGIQDIPMTDKDLAKAFARPVVILLGDQDVNPNHKSLRRTAEADRQGITRFERGHSFFETAKAKATELGVPFNWQLITVPGVAHSDPGMSKAAAKLIANTL